MPFDEQDDLLEHFVEDSTLDTTTTPAIEPSEVTDAGREHIAAAEGAQIDRSAPLDLDGVVSSYWACALWSSTDHGGDGLDLNYDIAAIDNDNRLAVEREVRVFVFEHSDDFRAWDDSAQFGHDLWLTRNGHGAAFWDRERGDLGERLSKAAKDAGTQDLYVGDDGKLYVTPIAEIDELTETTALQASLGYDETDAAERARIIEFARRINAQAIEDDLSGPGKYEGINAQDRQFAAALLTLANNGDADHDYEDGSSRIGWHIVGEDENGFVWYGTEEEDAREELTESEAESKFDEHLTEAYGAVEVCGMTMDAGKVLKECDEPAYREAFNNWVDAEDIELV